jgi:hypothetical protein
MNRHLTCKSDGLATEDVGSLNYQSLSCCLPDLRAVLVISLNKLPLFTNPYRQPFALT